jgi:hypothetical protein
MQRSQRRYQFGLLLGAMICAPLGYGIRFATGITPEWLNNAAGNVAYESFWIWLILGIWPQLRPLAVAITVCLLTCGLEVLQLSQEPLLVAARSTTIGRLILGSGFTWEDFPTYFLGSAIGGYFAIALRRRYSARIT